MESELNKTLPKHGCGSCPVQSTLLTEEAVAPVKVQHTAVPTFNGTSNAELQGCKVTSMIMGRPMAVTKPLASTVHWSTTTKLMPGPNGGINAIVNQRSRQCMQDHTQPLTPAHEAVAFVRPSTTPRERARRLHPLIVSRRLWNAWSVIRQQLLPL
jgi:hypothetical protein